LNLDFVPPQLQEGVSPSGLIAVRPLIDYEFAAPEISSCLLALVREFTRPRYNHSGATWFLRIFGRA